MHLTRALLGVAGVPLLSGCMMVPGAGHAGHLVAVAAPVQSEHWQVPALLQRAETSSGGLTIALWFSTPSRGTEVEIDAQLRTDSAPDELADGDIWLRIQPPRGSVEQLRMDRVHSFAAGSYQTHYRFPAAGSYLVTAEGRTGAGTDTRTVSVTTEVEVRRVAHDGRNDWLTPVAILGGLGTVVWMALMMGGSLF